LLLIDLELTEAGELRIGWFDTGPAAERLRGGDVEKDAFIAADAVPAFCFALLKKELTGRPDALTYVKAVCDDAGISYRESGWN
jgi:hypothetical protein